MDSEVRKTKRDTRNELATIDRTEEFKLLEGIQTAADIRERRKIQNRYSQRRLRDYKKTKIEELEGILSEERKALQQLKEENGLLKAQLLQMQEMMMRGFPMLPSPGFMPLNPMNFMPNGGMPVMQNAIQNGIQLGMNGIQNGMSSQHHVSSHIPKFKQQFDHMHLSIPPLPSNNKQADEPTPTTTESSQVVQALLGMGRAFPGPVMNVQRSATPAL
jgi:hypothetical protein